MANLQTLPPGETSIFKIVAKIRELIAFGSGAGRNMLAANTTLYVRTDGSDSNNGLANSAAGAFLTIQKALDVVAATDIGIYDVTIQVAAGTYAQALTVTGPWLGSGDVFLVGDTTTPSNVVIQTTASTTPGILVETYGRLKVGGFRFDIHQNGADGGAGFDNAIHANLGGIVVLTGKCEFACLGMALLASNDSTISSESIDHIVTIFGYGLFQAERRSTVVYTGGTTTITNGLTTLSAFAASSDNSVVYGFGTTWARAGGGVLAVTGTRFNVVAGALLQTFGSGATYFPGTVAGTGTDYTVTPWGLYQ